MGKTCPHCKSSDLDVDPSRGDTVCMGCGSVLEENTIVSEVTIQENADGSSSVVGQFVSSEGSYKPYLSGFQYGIGKDSRQVTLDKGKQSIRELADRLKLNKHCVDTAFNFFKMAIAKRLSRGRRISHLVAASLYLTCRTEGTPHLLLDFSDVTQVNVFVLGKIFLLLAKELHIHLPVLDPCMYITRFAHRLDFGDKTRDVAVTALRLVSRMKRDWIHTGRRPSGLCGAALLVAARFHGFNCELNDVMKVVKIGQDTIRKRLTEFESTPSSQLTINEFMNIDLEAEHDPPAFYNGRIKSKMQQMEAEAGGYSNIENQIGILSTAIDDKLLQSRPETPSEKSATLRKIQQKPAEKLPVITDEDETDPDMQASASFVHAENPEVVAEKFVSPKRPTSSLQPPAETSARVSGPAPTMVSLGLNQSVSESLQIPSPDRKGKRRPSKEGELELDGIDDEEIDTMLLTPHESEIKSKIWNQEFAEFVVELEEKRRKKAEEQKKRRRVFKGDHKRRKEYYSESRTAGEAIEKLFNRQKLSNKIDYEALRKATEVDHKPKPEPEVVDETPNRPPVVELPMLEPAKPKRAKICAEACLNLQDDQSSSVEQLEVVEESKTLPEPEEEPDDEEEEGEEEEEEYGGCVSASQLMQKAGISGQQEFGYGYEIDDYD